MLAAAAIRSNLVPRLVVVLLRGQAFVSIGSNRRVSRLRDRSTLFDNLQ